MYGLDLAFSFCNLLARVYKAIPLCSQPLDISLLSLCQHNKMLLPAELSQGPISQIKIPVTFLGGLLPGLQRWWFFTSLVAGMHPPDRRENGLLIRCQQTAWSGGKTHPPGESGWGTQTHNRTWWGTGTNEGSGAHQTGKNPGSNSGLPQEAERESNQQPVRHPSNLLLGWNRVSQGVGQRYCAVLECVKVRAWDAVQLQSECGIPICRCVANSYGQGWALTRPLVQGFYGLTTAKEMPKFLQGEQPETNEAIEDLV
jgi:hypothetical protein